MSTNVSTVISGVAYPVASVAGRDATVLAQFLGETGFTIDIDGTPCMVNGCGGPLDGQVRFHEKDDLGKDVRVWHIAQAGSGFTAEHIAAF